MMVCDGYPDYGPEGRRWCTDHGRWHSIGEINKGIWQLFDALGAGDYSYFDSKSGVVDMQASDIVRALLAAGWTPPRGDG